MLPLYPNDIKFPVLTLSIIFMNIGIFIFLLTLNQFQLVQTYYRYGVVPVIIFTQERFIQLITYGFIHDNVMHLLGNMWLLWLSGSILESTKSKIFYIFFVFLAAIVTALIYIMANNNSTTILVGFSGAIAGIMGYVFVTANNTIRTYIFPLFIVNINVKVLFVLWLVIQCLLMIYFPTSEVSVISHIAGFTLGVLVGLMDFTVKKKIF
ncbi:MAG: rhomboid family intramembrane serine protease [Syntrophomonadaceae bacterium]|nr:rhomboid family intramembrane serine protease [Syntrophomonadaceae bacterium]